MKTLCIFTDVSVNSQSKIGFGAVLTLTDIDLQTNNSNFFKNKVKYKIFKSTSSTKLEIETLLWAMEEIIKSYLSSNLYDNLLIYTDSQCIAGLLNRREKMEKSNYKSIRKNKALNHAALYKQFYHFYDLLNFKIIKLEGHSKSSLKDNLHNFFSLVDKGSRKALKNYIKKLS